jgi:hypothetical protein
MIVMMLVLLGPRPAAFAAGPAAATVTLKASLPSGRPVGTRITWTATAPGLKTPVYRFSVVSGAGPARVVRDFSRANSFIWAPLQEGAYTIQVTAKDGFAATSTTQATTAFTITSPVKGKRAVVSPTANPLVALYSAPSCAGVLTVRFRPAAGSAATWQSMLPHACGAGESVNVLVAGMRASTRYLLQAVVSNGGESTTSSSLTFTTGKPEAGLQITTFTVKLAPTAQADPATSFIFQALIPTASPTFANPIATDRGGNLLWYYDTLHSGLTVVWPVRMLPNTTLILGNDGYHKTGDDVLREVDLAGNPVGETNVDAINAQLAARGQEPIYMFHHDAMRLPDGDTAVLGATQKKFNGHDVMSDMVVVLDNNWQVVWSWDTFAHFTPPATWPAGQATCLSTGADLCGLPDPKAIDWTHGNALDWSTSDSNLLVSFRLLSMVIKINYQNGHGNGTVIWRLGQGYDFRLAASDPQPWFTYQHNPTYVSATDIVVFDDGNLRCQNGKVKGCQSRGQEYSLDEQHHTATLIFSANLGTVWQALGSAQRLPNANLTFAGGYLPPSKEVEFASSGTKVYELDTAVAVYRAYWLTAL